MGAAPRPRKRAALETSRQGARAEELCPEGDACEPTLLHCASNKPGKVALAEERFGAVAVCPMGRDPTLHVVPRIRRLAGDAYLIMDV